MTDTGSMQRRIGRYEIVRELGRGGMAIVYLARQPALDRLVALKELAVFGSDDQQMVHRFLREAQIAGSLNDPNIVTVYESFVEDAKPLIVMEYLAPGALRPLVGRLRIAQSIAVMHDVLSGLAAAGKRNIVHRDLKPENLLVTEDGRVKIADFGIAKAVDRAATAEFRTAQGMTVGTPTYMAPEQAMGAELTPVTDLYSLGVIAYELMVGRLPFDSDSPVALLLHHVSDPPPPPLSLNPTLDPGIAAWIERMLVKEPAERMPTAAQAWDELEDIALGLLGPRWRRDAALPDPRTGLAPPPSPPTPRRSGYVTVDPDRFAPSQPAPGSTDDQPTAIANPLRDPPLVGRDSPPIQPIPERLRATPPPAAGDPPGEPTVTPDPFPPPEPVGDLFRAPPRAVPAPARLPTPPPAPPSEELDATVPPQRPLPTPAPIEARPPARRARWALWVPILLVLAAGAAAAAFFARPNEQAIAPERTPAPTNTAPTAFPNDAFTITLPAGWKPVCQDQRRSCSNQNVPEGTWRSAYVSGAGQRALRLTIDRIPLTGALRGVQPTEVVDQVEETLSSNLTGYVRSSGTVRTQTIGDRRRAMAFAFRSDAPEFGHGSVFVFKAGSDAYVVTGIGSDARAALGVAQGAAQAIEPG